MEDLGITAHRAAKRAGTTQRYINLLIHKENSPFPGARPLDPETPKSPIIIPTAEFEAWLKGRDPSKQYWRGKKKDTPAPRKKKAQSSRND